MGWCICTTLKRQHHTGQKLLRIKRDELYREAGFKSWSAYCKSGRIDYKTTQANDYIRASQLRPKLTGMPVDFSVRQMLELCKCETDNDAKRIARKPVSPAVARPVTVTQMSNGKRRNRLASRDIPARDGCPWMDRGRPFFMRWPDLTCGPLLRCRAEKRDRKMTGK